MFFLQEGQEERPLFGLAPMAGFTDKAMRQVCRYFGADFVVTEMVSAKALTYGNKKSFSLLDLSGEKQPIAVQLFGSDPDIMAEAAQIAVRRGVTWLDINMGCPVPKVVNNGEGSALLKTPERAAAIVRAMTTAVDVPVTAKFRIGWDAPDPALPEFAAQLAEAGAAALCVHGRTRMQYYSGRADWTAIRQVVEAVKIPVFANGDVATVEDGLRILQATGAAGAMVGRGALGQPWLFAQLQAAVAGTPIPSAPTRLVRAHIIWQHAQLAVADKGEAVAMRELRKVLGWYAKGLPGATDFRRAMSSLSSLKDLANVLQHWQPDFDANHTNNIIDVVNSGCDANRFHVE